MSEPVIQSPKEFYLWKVFEAAARPILHATSEGFRTDHKDQWFWNDLEDVFQSAGENARKEFHRRRRTSSDQELFEAYDYLSAAALAGKALDTWRNLERIGAGDRLKETLSGVSALVEDWARKTSQLRFVSALNNRITVDPVGSGEKALKFILEAVYLERAKMDFAEACQTADLDSPTQGVKESPQPSVPAKTGKPRSKALGTTEQKRRNLIRELSEAGFEGLEYAREADKRKLAPKGIWIAEGWPGSYERAYKDKDWRKRIQDEKHRACSRQA